MSLFRKGCSLCGGRLDHNKICVECGLDNSKSDENYISAGQTHHDSEALTHVHTEYDPMAGKTVTKDSMKKAASKKQRTFRVNTYKTNSSRITGKPQKRKSKVGLVIAVFVVLVNVIPLLMNLVEDISERTPEYESGYEETETIEIETDPYAFVTRELDSEGLNYEAELTAGTYKGGVHIPEGTYMVVFIPEEGVESCYMDLSMNDMENGIYQTIYFGDSEQLYAIDDFRVYTGGIVNIEGRGTLYFGSSNARPQDMRSETNPNTQNYYLIDTVEVGTDIVPGVYDVICESGSGIFDYEVETSEGYSVYCGKLIGDQESGFAGSLKNIVLPEGTMVYIDGLTVTLLPSDRIESEEYEMFYDNY